MRGSDGLGGVPDLVLGTPLTGHTSRSTDCLDLDATTTGTAPTDNNDSLMSSLVTPMSSSKLIMSPSTCTCHSDNKISPSRYRVRYREKMRKYHAVIRLNTSNSDMSTLDLSNMEEGEVPDNPALYYTIDSRRLASKHKKSLRERYSSCSNRVLSGIVKSNIKKTY